MTDIAYPPSAYAPNGQLWWQPSSRDENNHPLGVERRLAAWLAFNKQVGDTFTTKEVRVALGEREKPNADEHFQRRLRQLRKDGWDIPSTKYDASLKAGQYRVDKIGWHPAIGERPKRVSFVSATDRAAVFKRDGSRCQVCGVGAGEPYPGEPDTKAVMTVGHVLSQNFGGVGKIANLRTECSRCNEPIRSEGGKPESSEEVVTAARGLRTADRRRLYQWITAGHRIWEPIDEVYDRFRRLTPGDREVAAAEIAKAAGITQR